MADNPSLKFPDVAFLFNIDDEAKCLPGSCPAPMFSLMKKWNGTHGEQEEILMPVLYHPNDGLVNYPWCGSRP